VLLSRMMVTHGLVRLVHAALAALLCAINATLALHRARAARRRAHYAAQARRNLRLDKSAALNALRMIVLFVVC